MCSIFNLPRAKTLRPLGPSPTEMETIIKAQGDQNTSVFCILCLWWQKPSDTSEIYVIFIFPLLLYLVAIKSVVNSQHLFLFFHYIYIQSAIQIMYVIRLDGVQSTHTVHQRKNLLRYEGGGKLEVRHPK